MRSPLSAGSTNSSPSLRPSAVSTLSARRGAEVGLHRQAVDHHLDVVLQLLVEGGDVADLVELAVDPHALEAALLQVEQLLLVFALAAARDRRQQVDAGALRQGQNPIDHLADGLAFDRQAGRRRIGDADAREQQAQVVVDLRDRADGRARVLGGGLLLDRDRGRQALDQFHVRLLHQLQELARIGGERFDIAPLALGIDGVEGEGGLARAGKAGDDGQRLARDIDVDVLEIVLFGAAHGDRPVRPEVRAIRPVRPIARRRHVCLFPFGR